MIAVIFEAVPAAGFRDVYLDTAAAIRGELEHVDGFVSIERFESVTHPGKLLSLSFWRDEDAVRRWRTLESHRRAQRAGRDHIFAEYRIRVASVVRDYGLDDRAGAPPDSIVAHD